MADLEAGRNVGVNQPPFNRRWALASGRSGDRFPANRKTHSQEVKPDEILR
jgi:hypothetical protein